MASKHNFRMFICKCYEGHIFRTYTGELLRLYVEQLKLLLNLSYLRFK